MFFANFEPAVVSHGEILTELRNAPPSLVQPAELHDFNFTGDRRLSGELLFSPLSAESWVRGALREVLLQAPPSETRECALLPGASLREMLRGFAEVPSISRVRFAERLARAGAIDSDTVSFLEGKFDNVAALLSVPERVTLGRALVAEREAASLERLLRASGSLAELSEVVIALDPALIASLSPELREYAALATVLPELQRLEVRPTDPRGDISCEIEALDSALIAALRICISPDRYADTRVVGELRATILDDIRSLEEALTRAAAPEARREVVAVHRAAFEVELRYGVDITTGEGEDLMGGAPTHSDHLVWRAPREESPVPETWRMKDIAEIDSILAGLPEGRLLLTPLIHRIELVETLGENVLGARYQDDGRIKIARIALDHPGISAAVHNVSSLVFVLTHELGHSFQIGGGKAGYVIEGGVIDFAPGEPTIDFREFAALAGWEVIEPQRYELGERFGIVVLDGRELPCGAPVEHRGRRIVLSLNPFTGILVSVDADAEFSRRWYSRTSPWEDFAEAFAYYHTCPEILIIDAPQKFRHLDEEFRRYSTDPQLQGLLRAALSIGRATDRDVIKTGVNRPTNPSSVSPGEKTTRSEDI